ncbi:MAG: phosphatase PAP2 family protein, partial [Bacteroidetes bacterium]|nr:phosphatase PAP2 family protein [Bacteroidota bacterium]
FPSGHATTVFAFTTPWVLYYPGVPTYGLLALSAGTAYARLADNVHWFTDVMAGSAIGIATAYWLTRRHQEAVERSRLQPILAADRIGFRVRLGP